MKKLRSVLIVCMAVLLMLACAIPAQADTVPYLAEIEYPLYNGQILFVRYFYA